MKDNIIDAAELIFARKGFAGTTTREIASRSRANKNLIFYYFGNKSGLYKTILERNLGPIIESLLKTLSTDAALEHKIDSIIDTYYNAVAENPGILPPLLARELAAGAPFFKNFIAGKIDQVKPLLSKAFQSEENSFSNYFKLTSIIAVILFSFLLSPVRAVIADHVNVSSPDEAYIRDQIRQITKYGVLQ